MYQLKVMQLLDEGDAVQAERARHDRENLGFCRMTKASFMQESPPQIYRLQRGVSRIAVRGVPVSEAQGLVCSERDKWGQH